MTLFQKIIALVIQSEENEIVKFKKKVFKSILNSSLKYFYKLSKHF